MHQCNEVQFETVMDAELNCMTVYQHTGRMPGSLSSSLYTKNLVECVIVHIWHSSPGIYCIWRLRFVTFF